MGKQLFCTESWKGIPRDNRPVGLKRLLQRKKERKKEKSKRIYFIQQFGARVQLGVRGVALQSRPRSSEPTGSLQRALRPYPLSRCRRSGSAAAGTRLRSRRTEPRRGRERSGGGSWGAACPGPSRPALPPPLPPRYLP